jgi:hypothetical protein
VTALQPAGGADEANEDQTQEIHENKALLGHHGIEHNHGPQKKRMNELIQGPNGQRDSGAQDPKNRRTDEDQGRGTKSREQSVRKQKVKTNGPIPGFM